VSTRFGFILLQGSLTVLRLLCACSIIFLYYIISACMLLYYCNTVRWAWLDWGLSGWLTTLLQCFDCWHCWLGHQTCSNDSCQKLLQFHVLTTLSLTILVCLHSFSCWSVRDLRNSLKIQTYRVQGHRSWCQSKAHVYFPISH